MFESCIYAILPHLICACKSTVEEKVVQKNVNDDKSLNRRLNDIMSKHASDHTVRSICIAVGIIFACVIIYFICKHLVKKCKRNLLMGLQDASDRRIVTYARRFSQAGAIRATVNQERGHEDNIIPK